MVGTPVEQHPDGLDNASMKCHLTRTDNMDAHGPWARGVPMCFWADHSIVASATVIKVPVPSLEDATQTVADLRRIIRVAD